jgi:hypothetical protein
MARMAMATTVTRLVFLLRRMIASTAADVLPSVTKHLRDINDAGQPARAAAGSGLATRRFQSVRRGGHRPGHRLRSRKFHR